MVGGRRKWAKWKTRTITNVCREEPEEVAKMKTNVGKTTGEEGAKTGQEFSCPPASKPSRPMQDVIETARK